MSTKNERAMDNEFRKRVALVMLPTIWRETEDTGGLVSNKPRIVADQVAELAEYLDKKINKES